MKIKHEELTKCEELVMKIIWDSEEELGLIEIQTRVNAKFNKDWKPQTVSTFLSRLVNKRYLKSYRSGRIFLYQILVPLTDYRSQLTDEYVKSWFNDNADGFIESLLHERSLRNDEIKRINDFISNKLAIV